MAIAMFACCNGATEARRPDAEEIPATEAALRETILRNMPTNSGQRCVGISVVTEALLDGDRADSNSRDAVDDVARRIYRSLVTGDRLHYHPKLLIDSEATSSESRAAIDKLSALVTDYYKQDFLRLSKTEQGRKRLLAAEDSFVATDKELDRILEAEPDKIDAFLGSGTRAFPDDTLEETHHVFLVGKLANGHTYVYDSNAPGTAIACKLTNRHDGVEVEWTCQYRDTEKETRQRYLVVHKDRFFQLILGE